MREHDINNFKSKPYYDVEIELENKIIAKLEISDWTEENHIYDLKLVNSLTEITNVTATSITTEEKQDHPRPPFISSTLQQTAFKIYGFSPKKTMELAQALHVMGAITYHRTDNPNLSTDGYEMMKNWLINKELPFTEKQKKYKGKSSAQEAHEGIRPTDISLAEMGDDANTINLYKLIRERSVASEMKPSIDEVTTCEFIYSENFRLGE